MSITHAEIDFNLQGTPVSRAFDDVYFSNQDGVEETRYVFLRGNQLPSRFITHKKPVFVVAETGFGTGLNFLTLCDAFQRFRCEHPTAVLKQLHFISVEKFPLTQRDLVNVHQIWPQFQPLSNQLQQIWPEAQAGCHRLSFDRQHITLDLWFGDINQLVPTLTPILKNRIDAWFLDGFAPSKNPDMWTPQLFNLMVNGSTQNGTFATFTAAGFVRRGLQEAGFEVMRVKGFGSKREMLVGKI